MDPQLAKKQIKRISRGTFAMAVLFAIQCFSFQNYSHKLLNLIPSHSRQTFPLSHSHTLAYSNPPKISPNFHFRTQILFNFYFFVSFLFRSVRFSLNLVSNFCSTTFPFWNFGHLHLPHLTLSLRYLPSSCFVFNCFWDFLFIFP